MLTGKTTYYNIPLYNRNDTPVNLNNDWTEAFAAIDTAMWDVNEEESGNLDKIQDIITDAKLIQNQYTQNEKDITLLNNRLVNVNVQAEVAKTTAQNALTLSQSAESDVQSASNNANTALNTAQEALDTSNNLNNQVASLEQRISALGG